MKHLMTFDSVVPYINIFDAVIKNSLDTIRYLIINGCDLNLKNDKGETALITSCNYSRNDISKELIKSGANINIVDDYGNSPLIYASFRNNIDVIRLLIEYDADWNIINNDDYDVMTYLKWNDLVDTIISEYPEEYKKYLINKESEKYNL